MQRVRAAVARDDRRVAARVDSNWLWRTGRRPHDEPAAMSDAMREAFVPVLAYDPSAPDAMFSAYVTGLSPSPIAD